MKLRFCKYCGETWHKSYQCFYKPRKESKPCGHCGGASHLTWQCFLNPNREVQMKKKLKNGVVAKRWLAARKLWYRKNKADHYECYICGKWLTRQETTLDHIKSRSRHPELRYELSNLAPCCPGCNTNKGSRDLEEVKP